MTLRYIPIIEQTLDVMYPERQDQEQLNLENVRFKLFLPKTTSLLSAYQQLKSLSITHCDIRNLQNFPKLPHLEELDLSFNQIQGTFNHLIPLKKLKYLNIEDNIVFESTKFAPLKKIASAYRGQQSSSNSLKISICLRKNPFVNDESAYINKLKGYGLKVVKEPKQYFDKKKTEDQKANKSSKKGHSSSGKKNKKLNNKKDKKAKKRIHEQLDSFYSRQSSVMSDSSSSSSSDSDDNPNPTQTIANNNQPGRQYHRVSHRLGLDSNSQARLAIRMSRQRSQLGNVFDPFIMDSGDMDGGGMLVLEDSENSEAADRDRFAAVGRANIEERMRIMEDRNSARRQEARQRNEDNTQRDRERIERMRDIERREQHLRRRNARQMQVIRHMQQSRQRLLVRPSLLMRDYNNSSAGLSSLRNNSNINDMIDEWALNPFRRRSSGASGSGLAVNINGPRDVNSNSGANTNLASGQSARNESGGGRPGSFIQQVRALERQSSRNSNDLSMVSPVYEPLRVRQSSDFPNIIRLSRHESYNSQISNALVNERQNQVNRESQGIRFDMNSSVSDQDIDNDDENDENQLIDDDDDEEMDQMMQDDDQEDQDGDMLHECDELCEHDSEGQGGDEDEDLEESDQEEEEQQNQDDEEEIEDADPQMIFSVIPQIEDYNFGYMMEDHLLERPMNDWGANLQLHEDGLMRPPANSERNASLSSNINPDSSSNLERQAQDEESFEPI